MPNTRKYSQTWAIGYLRGSASGYRRGTVSLRRVTASVTLALRRASRTTRRIAFCCSTPWSGMGHASRRSMRALPANGGGIPEKVKGQRLKVKARSLKPKPEALRRFGDHRLPGVAVHSDLSAVTGSTWAARYAGLKTAITRTTASASSAPSTTTGPAPPPDRAGTAARACPSSRAQSPPARRR